MSHERKEVFLRTAMLYTFRYDLNSAVGTRKLLYNIKRPIS